MGHHKACQGHPRHHTKASLRRNELLKLTGNLLQLGDALKKMHTVLVETFRSVSGAY
jgi:hypothetical protein